MTIKVTLDDIRRGEPCMTGWCPIALAISRKLPAATTVQVYDTLVEIDDRKYLLPETAKEFIQQFDDGDGGCTFEFDLPGVGAEPGEENGESKSGACSPSVRVSDSPEETSANT